MAIIGSVSLAARRGIIIKDPAVLEQIDTCRVAIFDKTGTLTYGQPIVSEVLPGPGFAANDVLTTDGEPRAIFPASAGGGNARGGEESPIETRRSTRSQRKTGRRAARQNRWPSGSSDEPEKTGNRSIRNLLPQLPEQVGGLECVVLIGQPICRDDSIPR